MRKICNKAKVWIVKKGDWYIKFNIFRIYMTFVNS